MGNHIITGLMTNPTLNTESILIFVVQNNGQAIKCMATQTTTDDVDVRPGMDLEVTETRAAKLEKTFKVQEGAAAGKSICRFSLPS